MKEVERVEAAQTQTDGKHYQVEGDDPPPDSVVHRGLLSRLKGGMLGVGASKLCQSRSHSLERKGVGHRGEDGGRRVSNVTEKVPL